MKRFIVLACVCILIAPNSNAGIMEFCSGVLKTFTQTYAYADFAQERPEWKGLDEIFVNWAAWKKVRTFGPTRYRMDGWQTTRTVSQGVWTLSYWKALNMAFLKFTVRPGEGLPSSVQSLLTKASEASGQNMHILDDPRLSNEVIDGIFSMHLIGGGEIEMLPHHTNGTVSLPLVKAFLSIANPEPSYAEALD